MREPFDEDHLADRAVAEVVRQGLFRFETREEFMLVSRGPLMLRRLTKILGRKGTDR
jgi:hypothetical protein